VSSISSTPLVMGQNIKDIKVYYELLDLGRFPIARSHMRSDEDIHRAEIIHKIMCQNIIQKNLLDGLNHGSHERLLSLLEEGLIEDHGPIYNVTEKGMTFVRYIASLFDTYYQEDL